MNENPGSKHPLGFSGCGTIYQLKQLSLFASDTKWYSVDDGYQDFKSLPKMRWHPPMLLKSLPRMEYVVRKCAGLAFVLLAPATVLASAKNVAAPTEPVHFAIADFDGDNQPDIATVQAGQANSINTRYWIGFRLSSGATSIVDITAPTGGLRITSRDMNGDNFLDVVVTTAWTDRPVTVLLNDGHGNFTPSDPARYASLFQTSQPTWSGAHDEARDAAVLLLRQPSGPGEKRGAVDAPVRVTGSILFPRRRDYFILTPLASFGRAPPVV